MPPRRSQKPPKREPSPNNNKPKPATPTPEVKSATPPPEVESDDTGPIFFDMPQQYTLLSQWYPANFGVYESQISQLVQREFEPVDPFGGKLPFNCVGQFILYCKAARFGADGLQKQILAALDPDPKVQKALSRLTVGGFVPESWDEVKRAVAEAGNIAKFELYPKLKSVLLGTGDRLLAEAAPDDRVWGIGFGYWDALANQANWGENLQGKALMAARDHFRREEAELERDESDDQESQDDGSDDQESQDDGSDDQESQDWSEDQGGQDGGSDDERTGEGEVPSEPKS